MTALDRERARVHAVEDVMKEIRQEATLSDKAHAYQTFCAIPNREMRAPTDLYEEAGDRLAQE